MLAYLPAQSFGSYYDRKTKNITFLILYFSETVLNRIISTLLVLKGQPIVKYTHGVLSNSAVERLVNHLYCLHIKQHHLNVYISILAWIR